MITATITALLICVFISACMLTFKLLKSPNLEQIEKSVIHELSNRAHQLCNLAYESQRPVNAEQREAMEEKFQDDLYEYMEDYHIEVATRLRKEKVKNIEAYGYVRI